MLRNYLTIAYRNLKRQPGYAAINIAGLAVGMAVALLILLFVRHETSYDNFHAKADRTYRVLLKSGNDIHTSLPEPAVSGLRRTFPEVEQSVQMQVPYDGMLVQTPDEQFYEDGFMTAGSAFFQVFSFESVAGDLSTALDQPGSVVLTAPTARKYFGEENPIGRTLTANFATEKKRYTVKAVVEPVSSNTHLDFSMVARRIERGNTRWNYRYGPGYIVLHEDASVEALEQKLPVFVQRSAGKSAGPGERTDHFGLHLQPLTDIHLEPDPEAATEKTGPMQYLYIFSAAALLILLIACINYMNLATARAARRAKEVGVRKVVGAHRLQLARQFLGESVLMSLGAMLLALVLVQLSLPLFNRIAGTGLALNGIEAPGWIGVFVGAAVLVGIISGSYPALFLSGFEPTKVLQSGFARRGSGAVFRKGLVVFQFAASVMLILATAIIYQQMEFIRTERLNAHDDEIVVLPNSRPVSQSYDAFKRELLAHPEVAHVAAGHPPGSVRGHATYRDSNNVETRLNSLHVGHDYLKTIGLKPVAGRDFSKGRVSDENEAIIINERAAKWRGLEHPVGKKDERLGGTIIGVVRDFHVLPMYQSIDPLVIKLGTGRFYPTLVRLKEVQIASGLDTIQQTWRTFSDRPLLYSFLDDELDKAYRAELRLGQIFGAFGLIAIFIACLGLFGLAAYTAERRTKEIGIRKVFGASVTDIVLLLSRDFAALVLIAVVIAVPVAYYAMHRWLQDFAYRIDLSPWIFAAAGAGALLIALLTVSYQAVKAALADPVDAIRYE